MNKITAQALKPRFRDKKNADSGFSLPELLTVVAIIAILAAFSAPSIMKWLPGIYLKAAARDLYTNMQNAKIQAVKENRDWAVVFDKAGNSYSICNGQGADLTWVPPNDCIETVNLSDYKGNIYFGKGIATTSVSGGAWGNYITYAAPDDTVVFNPRGSGNAGYVYLENETPNEGTAFAVGTTTSGRLRLVRWTGAWK